MGRNYVYIAIRGLMYINRRWLEKEFGVGRGFAVLHLEVDAIPAD